MAAREARRAVPLAWGIGMFSLALVGASLVLLPLDWRAIDSITTARLGYFLGAPITSILGLLIAIRRPRNAIGWLLLAIAMADSICLFADFTAIRGLLSGASPGAWVAWAAWVYKTGFGIGALLLLCVVFLFPNGSVLPGPRWRWAARVGLTATVVLTASTMVAAQSAQLSPRLPSLTNPLAIPALDSLTNNNGTLQSLLFLLMFLILVAEVVVRFRRSQGVERRQMRWFAYVAATALGIFILTFTPLLSDAGTAIDNYTLDFGLVVALPLAIGLAVMRYGLYDLDVFISRSIVYGSLAVFISAVYVGIAVGFGALVGSGGKPNLALSIVATAIVAIGFQPVRERVQKVANYLVYGKRATPYEVLSQFSERVAESYASDEVLPRMARVLADGTGAELSEIWLRSGDELRRAAAFPLESAIPPALHANGAGELSTSTADRSVVVRHRGEVLGMLAVTKRRGESLTPIEIKLMDDLAHQAGLVLKNVGLTADLQARLADLRASRQRLVAAQDDERRKLERNLHDGAQQYLVAIRVKLGLAEMLLTRDSRKAMTTLEQLKGDADDALEALRDLARGIYPPLLAEKGLPTALQAQARKATLPITIDADGIGRYSQDTEAALYFCILEAVQNIQKYAQASRAVVRLREDGDQLAVEVIDNGSGFVVSTTARGSGLTNMEDRLDALGGNLEVESTLGKGTTLRAIVPVSHPVLAASRPS
ncbi:MAG TPA: sensor histidine kinase [Candidatus Saccharimonadales bacterium]|nr:sensor histidine kinase [Candidatus Saccharimonadales bacterium]